MAASTPVVLSEFMRADLRETETWRDVDSICNRLYEPAIDKISGAADLAPSPDGTRIAFTGKIFGSDWRSTPAKSKVCVVDVATSDVEIITSGANNDMLPKWSPNGKFLAFLSDRKESGHFQLYLLTVGGLGEAKPLPFVDGVVEQFHWHSAGSKILIHSADIGAAKPGAGGSGKVEDSVKENTPSWMPSVDVGDPSREWRSIWLYDLGDKKLTRLSGKGYNPWETNWLDSKSILSIASDSPSEDAYSTTLSLWNIETQSKKVLYTPKRQLGCPVSIPSSRKVAVIEALASDRGVIFGDIKVINIDSGSVAQIDSLQVDVTQLIPGDDKNLFFVGTRGLNSAIGVLNLDSNKSTVLWESDRAIGHGIPTATMLPNGTFAVILEGWKERPAIVIVGPNNPKSILDFTHEGYKWLNSKLGPMRIVRWEAQDGLELEGYLHLPVMVERSTSKIPLVAHIHGGPVWYWSNTPAGLDFTTLLNLKGYAVFRPNPRGSAGRGQEFSEAVIGDMGGTDAQDILSGIRFLCNAEMSPFDSEKIGIIGGSYGGFMASFLPTIDPMFKASVSIAAPTDWNSFHTTSNIPSFDQLFLNADPFDPNGGSYLRRSPILNAGKYGTPVLQISGDQDFSVPTSQATQYHRACVQKDVDSAIVVYPGEGHGIVKFPALIDNMVRTIRWFDRYMPV